MIFVLIIQKHIEIENKMSGIFRKFLAVNCPEKNVKKIYVNFFYKCIKIVFFIYKVLLISKCFGHILFIYNSVSRTALEKGIFQALATAPALALATAQALTLAVAVALALDLTE